MMPDPKDLNKCFICGAPATNVVVTSKASHGFCDKCYDKVWDLVPNLLAWLEVSYKIK